MTTQTATPKEEQAQDQEQPQLSGEEQTQPVEERLSRLEAESRELKALASENNRILNEILDAFSQGTGSATMLVHSIGASGELLLRSPISVWIQVDEDQTLATIPEFEIVGEGVTEPEALSDAMVYLKELYEDLMSLPDEGLGKLPRKWKRVLKMLVIEDGSDV